MVGSGHLSALRSRSPRAPSSGRQTRPVSELLPRPTEEQRAVIAAVAAGRCVRVVASAGTGKTATLLRAAAELPGKRILFLAYNRDIREEVQGKVALFGLRHVQVENYDSLLLKHYDRTAATQDFQMSLQRILQQDSPPSEAFAWDAIFVDEAQDIDDSYMAFLNKIQTDNEVPREEIQVVSVGDRKQNIFRYRGADPKFFEEEGRLHTTSDLLRLTETFRFGKDLCAFVDYVCAPLFLDYVPHVSRLDASWPVERWVLPADKAAVPSALVARLQQARTEVGTTLTFLTGSKKENNEGLWRFLEQLGAHDPPVPFALVCEEPDGQPADGPALAFLRNVHACKGKTFACTVLFVTTLRSWLGTDGVEAEVLYVALTRSARLMVIESAESLVFQDILALAVRPPGPAPRCATTGQPATMEKQPRAGPRPQHVKTTLHERVGKMKVGVKQTLLQLLDAPPLREWGESDEPQAASALVTAAAWGRLHSQSEGPLSAFLEALPRGTAEAYQTLWRAQSTHLLAPHLRRRLERLAATPALGSAEFLEIARLGPSFHYGYLALAECTPEDCAASDVLFLRLLSELQQLSDPSHIYQLAGKPVAECGLYLSADKVVFFRTEDLDSEALCDRLLAAYGAAKLRVEGFEVTYVPSRLDRAVQRCPGALAAARATEYARVFEAAVA